MNSPSNSNRDRNPSPETQAIIDQIESTVAQFGEIAQSLEGVKVVHDKNWLQALRRAAKQSSQRYLAALPRLSKSQSQQWAKESEAQLKARYEAWIATLNTILDRAKGKP